MGSRQLTKEEGRPIWHSADACLLGNGKAVGILDQGTNCTSGEGPTRPVPVCFQLHVRTRYRSAPFTTT
jgi:hypothetical protein